MGIKKATFKHFDKSRLATIILFNELRVSAPQYFRITYDRKTTTFKSIFLDSVFEHINIFHRRKDSNIKLLWKELQQQLIDIDCEVLDLFF